ncbi:hypothetical protein BH09VER1_BH09VER1_08890 [soil metagenome]
MSPLPASLLASLWQAGLLWLALGVLLHLVPAARARLRYHLALAALLLVAGLWGFTWFSQNASLDVLAPAFTSPPAASFTRQIEVVQAATVSSHPADPPSFSWPQIIVLLWQAGVVLGFIRLVWSVRKAHRLCATSEVVTDLQWTLPLRQLCQTMGFRLEAGLRASVRVTCPVVMGFIDPVIILPASVLTGVPPAVIKATLAHEIAHLVRWDYVVNLVQMGIEALLFFNPFVWLISQSVRREREACCDQMASVACGDTLAYSEALLWWGRETAPIPAATLAVGGPISNLRDRVHRLLYPGETPLTRAGGWRAGGLTALIPLFLILSALLVHATISELTPRQRVALIEFLSKPFRERPIERVSPANAKPFSGLILDESGRPIVQAQWWISCPDVVDPVQGVTGTDGRYSGLASRSALTLTVRASNFAPLAVNYPPHASRENQSVVLSRGHDFRVQCVNGEGTPVSGAVVGITFSAIPFGSSRSTTDESGWATLTHQPLLPQATLTFDAPGYLAARQTGINLSGSIPLQPCILARAKPFMLRVEDEITGEPVPGVLVHICSISPQGAAFAYPSWNSSGMPTDSQGIARLDGLNPDLCYDMKAEGSRRGATFRINPRGGMSRTIRLPRERVLQVKISHLPDFPDGSFILQYSQNETENSSYARSIKLNVVGGEAQATLTGLMPKTLEFFILKQQIPGPLLTQEVTEFAIDYDKVKPHDLVHIIVKTKVGPRQAPPKGALWMNWALTKEAGTWDGRSVPIHDGIAEFDLPRNSWFHLGNSELLGGKVDENVRYQAQENPSKFEVPVSPAGIIRAKVLEPDGSMANDIFIMAQEPSNPKKPWISIKDFATARDAREWYISDPIELHSKQYQVVATSGLRYAVSPPFKISASNPIQDVVLTLPSPRPVTLSVVDPDGRPLGGVTLQFFMDVPPLENITGRSVTTDAHGVAHLELGNNSPKNLRAQPINNVLVPAMYPVDLSAGDPRIVLQKGKKLVGRFIDRTTNAGLSGCGVQWMLPSTNINSPRQPLSPDGRFEFNDVPDQEVFLSTSYPRGTEAVGNFYVHPSSQDLIFEIRDQPTKPQ